MIALRRGSTTRGAGGLPGRLRIAPAWRDGAHDMLGRYTARHGADVAVFEGSLGSQGYLHRLLAVGGDWGAVAAIPCHMDDPEVNVGLDQPGAGSHTVTFGDIFKIRPEILMVNTFSPFSLVLQHKRNNWSR